MKKEDNSIKICGNCSYFGTCNKTCTENSVKSDYNNNSCENFNNWIESEESEE